VVVVDVVVTPHDPMEVFICKASAVDDALPHCQCTILQELDMIAVIGKNTIDVELHLNVVSGETKLVYIFYQQKLFMLSCDAKIEKERGGRQREQKKQPDSIGDLPKLGFGILLFKLAFW
jgi:hypothetical protein